MYKVYRLNNGLRVITEYIDYVNSVSVGLWVENGSRNETPLNNGISHFIEHMFFKGTHKRSAKDIAESIENVGGQINAFTGKEATCFYIKTLSSHLDLSLDILSDMLFNSKFESEDIDKEKGVVIEEISMNEDSPEDVLADLHCKSVWGEDPISLPILGNAKNVKSFSRNHLLEYIEEYYIPENSVISICGKFDVNNINKIVEEYFGQWSSNKKRITNYSTPAILTNHLYKQKAIEQLHICLGLQGIPLGNDDVYTLLLLNNIFGGGVSSILFQNIREERGLCYTIYSYASSYNNTGSLNIYTSLNPSCAYDAVNYINEEIYNYYKQGISLEKLKIAKEQIKGSYILGLESTSSRMFSNGKAMLFLNKINTPEEVMKKIDNIDGDSVNKILEKCFKPGILNSAFVGSNIDFLKFENYLSKNTFANREIAPKLV